MSKMTFEEDPGSTRSDSELFSAKDTLKEGEGTSDAKSMSGPPKSPSIELPTGDVKPSPPEAMTPQQFATSKRKQKREFPPTTPLSHSVARKHIFTKRSLSTIV